MAETGKQIQWFPGHMAKTRRKIGESLSLVDAAVEILDARTPLSSRNPELNDILKDKPSLILLNKCDVADPEITDEWISYFKEKGIVAVAVDCKSGNGLKSFSAAVKNLLSQKIEAAKKKGINKALRLMVVGIPNVGKSSFINRLGDKHAKVEDRPGVTRGNQWFSTKDNFLLLDTPGVLWPKFEDEEVALRLAMTGAVKDSILDIEFIAVKLIEFLVSNSDYKAMLEERYKLEIHEEYEDSYDILCNIGAKRGMKARGGDTDTLRAAIMLVDEFRGVKIVRISLERPC